MFTKKFITYIGVITAILSLIGGIWAFDSHYATNDKVVEVEIRAKENVDDLEIQIAGALRCRLKRKRNEQSSTINDESGSA